MQAAFKNHITKPHILVAGGAEELEHSFHSVGDPQMKLLSGKLEFPGLVMTRLPPADRKQQGVLIHPGVMRRVGPWPGPLFLSP